jgi:DNA (cytosine-5)-methyltransferase 1
MGLTGVSLFAGIGGFELAMTRVGISPVASVEIDKKASGVLTEHFTDTTIMGDIKGVTSADLFSAGFDSANGIITGGFPCQDLSVAGRRAGLAGERSGLFWEIHRLIDQTKTKWFVLENVPGLLSSNDGRDMGIVLGSLAELGYGLAYRVLDAQHFGVAQRRRRVFIVGRLGDDWRTPAKILDLGEGRRGYHQKSITKGQGVATEIDASTATSYGQTGFSRYTEGVTTLTHSQHKRPEDNIVVEPYVKIVRSGERDAEGNLPAEVWAERQTAPTLNLMDNTGESRATVIVFNPHKEDGARVQGDVINTLTALMGTGGNNVPMLTAASAIRRLTPVECERLQGFPDDWTQISNGKQQADGSRYKQTGNAVAVPVVQWILGRIALSE